MSLNGSWAGPDAMDPRYAAAYGVIARTHWWWAVRDQVVLRTVATLREGQPRGRILDIGCGDGRLLDMLAADHDVVGIEPDPTTGAMTMPGRYPIHLCPFTPPLPIEGPFDIVMMLDVLEHLHDPVAALRLAASLLGEHGALVITVPAGPALWTTHDDLNHHRRRYTRQSLDDELHQAGLVPSSSRHFFHALGLAKLVLRGLETMHRRGPAVPRVPPPPINALARAFSALEFRAMAPFARILPGSSLLTVATPAR